MQNQLTKSVIRHRADSTKPWYKGYDDEQFICARDKAWYVESREGEFGPFESLDDAENFYYRRFEKKVSKQAV